MTEDLEEKIKTLVDDMAASIRQCKCVAHLLEANAGPANAMGDLQGRLDRLAERVAGLKDTRRLAAMPCGTGEGCWHCKPAADNT